MESNDGLDASRTGSPLIKEVWHEGDATLELVLFHVTSEARATSIPTNGLIDGEDGYMTDQTFRGVWLSDRPLDANEGACGETILQVSFPPTIDLADYEWVEEGKGYREWCVPADLINSEAKVSVSPRVA